MNVQQYLLSCLAEEGCEVGQRVSKALRFGLGEVQPGQPLDNAARIVEEVKDFISVAILLQERGILPRVMPDSAELLAKIEKVDKYLDYAANIGAVTPGVA